MFFDLQQKKIDDKRKELRIHLYTKFIMHFRPAYLCVKSFVLTLIFCELICMKITYLVSDNDLI